LTDALVLMAEMVTPENTSRFGFWLGRDAPGPLCRSGFYGDGVELHNPARFVGDETLDITVATVHPQPAAGHLAGTSRTAHPNLHSAWRQAVRAGAGVANRRCGAHRSQDSRGAWMMTDDSQRSGSA
jgi:hypothetical protein